MSCRPFSPQEGKFHLHCGNLQIRNERPSGIPVLMGLRMKEEALSRSLDVHNWLAQVFQVAAPAFSVAFPSPLVSTCDSASIEIQHTRDGIRHSDRQCGHSPFLSSKWPQALPQPLRLRCAPTCPIFPSSFSRMWVSHYLFLFPVPFP